MTPINTINYIKWINSGLLIAGNIFNTQCRDILSNTLNSLFLIHIPKRSIRQVE